MFTEIYDRSSKQKFDLTLKLLWYMNENLKTLSYFSVDTLREMLEFPWERIYEIRSNLMY